MAEDEKPQKKRIVAPGGAELKWCEEFNVVVRAQTTKQEQWEEMP